MKKFALPLRIVLVFILLVAFIFCAIKFIETLDIIVYTSEPVAAVEVKPTASPPLYYDRFVPYKEYAEAQENIDTPALNGEGGGFGAQPLPNPVEVETVMLWLDQE
jgi:hypothetical protein